MLGIIISLIFWILKKDKLKGVNELGKRNLNFKITWVLLFSLSYIIILARMTGIIPRLGVGTFFLFIPFVFYGFNAVIIVVNSMRVYQNKKVFYKSAIRMLR